MPCPLGENFPLDLGGIFLRGINESLNSHLDPPLTKYHNAAANSNCGGNQGPILIRINHTKPVIRTKELLFDTYSTMKTETEVD